jgi:hypothetical protein
MKSNLAKCIIIFSGSLTAINAQSIIELGESDGITKPEFACSNGVAPFELGGFNVEAALYDSHVDMLNTLWRKDIPFGETETRIEPSLMFNHSVPFVGDVTHFAFDVKDGIYRGVGIQGPDQADDTEVSESEALWIHFGGAKVYEVSFGVRAFFGLDKNKDHFEEGQVRLYIGNQQIDTQFNFTANDQEHDGQESYHLMSPVAFDSIGFLTNSHFELDTPANENHDFFLEYLDICCPPDASIKGDPHIQTWSGVMYDFHGVCDLVLLQNPDFEKGLGMDIHVRTEQLKQYSYVSSAVLRIGDDTLEVMGGNDDSSHWINQQANENSDDGIIGFLSGYPIVYKKINSKQHEYTVKIGGAKAIVMTTFKKLVRVSIEGASIESFGSSRGLLGSFGEGKMLARDGSTLLEDTNTFGQEWQVLPSEDMLFHSVEGPQAPEKCFIPLASSLRRRLGESKISEEEAQLACSRVSQEDFDMCVFDVMATGDKDVVGAY